MDWLERYRGEKLIIATKHAKEAVIGPVMQEAFGFIYEASHQLDTDLLGTFSGEIERTLSPLEAARKKCEWAMDLYGLDVAMASEGSFGAHPKYVFVPGGTELLVLVDRKNGLEIDVQATTTETNFNWKEVIPGQDFSEFLEQIKFPSHALIVKNSSPDFSQLEKGINSYESLYMVVDQFLQKYGKCILETDMRAMHNPTRMKQIEKLAHQLVEKMKVLCPTCAFPGYSITDFQSGLPCSLCQKPTSSILKVIRQCKKCGYQEENLYPDLKEFEDPMYCDFCNP
ncbi:DUF6671 family protein [Aquirufa rosea]|uniref:DUF6671 domain-containing protein n=1 Tax=Aquirufa rosea TaxID=2509241 RepID=A0A4Q1BZ41_9BACT|nr:DUF6671 family protein [Aquirufa rosea]RXK48822.1 hypothetical protein ESB04_07650 [Aquirufa rosea]